MEESTELDIGRYLRMIYKKRVLFVLIAMTVTSAVVLAGYLMPKVYEAKSVIFIERSFLNDMIKNVTIMPSIDERIKALATVMKSRSLLLKVMSDLDLDLNSKDPSEIERRLQNFKDKTEIKLELNRANSRDTDLFIVSYTGKNPNLVCNYVNALVRRYIEENLSKEREDAYGANQFLLEQIRRSADQEHLPHHGMDRRGHGKQSVTGPIDHDERRTGGAGHHDGRHDSDAADPFAAAAGDAVADRAGQAAAGACYRLPATRSACRSSDR